MPPRPLTHAEQAILSLVAEAPRHGYEIEQVIEERGMREWTEIGFSSIYYLLRKLEGKGLICATVDDSGAGPTRKVYRLTDASAASPYPPEGLRHNLRAPAERSPGHGLACAGV